MVVQSLEVRRMPNATIVGKKGHVQKECWQLTKKKGNDLETSKAQGCAASNSNNGEIMFSEAVKISKDRRQLIDNWLMDSGATWHMTFRKE